MFIVTAKLDKRKIIGGALILAALAAAAVLLLSGGKKAEPAADLAAVVKSNEQRVQYLRSLGWEVSEEPIDQQTVTIPKDFTKVYAEYNDLQKSQGFDLKKYAGFEATRYTYEVKNHPDAIGRVVADMLVYRGRLIGADIQCLSAEDGFMAGIAFPKAEGK